MDTVNRVFEDTKSGWDKIDKKKRNRLIVLVALIMILVLGFSYFGRRVSFATLFSNLELEDAGRIVNDLESKKISYKLTNGGRDILIDQKHVDSYRLQLAMDGNMPDKSTGFEIFDNMGMMVTDEDRKIMYQRALTGELQRSIMSLDVVNTAKVHLVMSEKSIFDTEAREASASVFIDLKSSRNFTEDMVRGIAALLSGAVDNLPEKNIKIIDSKGNLLSGFLEYENPQSSVGSINQFERMRDSFQTRLEGDLYDILGTALGRHKIRISVFADLDFDAEETTSITYSDPLIRSEQVTGDYDQVFYPADNGLIGDNPSNLIGSEDYLYRIYERITNNELSSETRTTIKAPGKVNRLTTSIIYDGNLSESNTDKIVSIVAAATGYDVDRGDFISIEGIPFDKSHMDGLDDPGDLEEPGEKGFFDKYKLLILIGGGAILLATIITVIVSRRRKEEEPEAQVPIYAPIGDLMMVEEEDLDEKLEMKKNPKEDKAKEYAKDNPDVAADMIRAWIKD